MKNVLAILAALSISATEDQESNERAILERTKKLGQLEALTGATGEEALGTVRAWKASHTALAPISTELSALKATSEKSELTALLKQGRDEKKLTKAESDKLQAQVEGYWVARAESKEPTGDQMSLAAAKSFVAIMSPKSHLVNEPKAPPASPESVTVVGAEGIVAHNGKPYEQMVSDEHAQLRSQEGGEAIYQDLRANWKLRGSPRITQKRAS